MQPLDAVANPGGIDPTGNAAGAHGSIGHIVPLQVLVAVFTALMALTAATVAITWFDLGGWNLLAALGIATLKASLVALYFMHLRYDSAFYSLIFITGLLFLALFLSLTILDSVEYQPDIQGYQETVADGV